jgi:hypothetical protein
VDSSCEHCNEPSGSILSLLRSILRLSTHLHRGLSSGHFPLAFPPISYMQFSSPPIRATCPANLIYFIIPEDGRTSLFKPVPCLKGPLTSAYDDYSFLFRRTFKACCLRRGCLHSSHFFRCCSHLFIAVIGVTASRLIMHNVGGFISLSCAS